MDEINHYRRQIREKLLALIAALQIEMEAEPPAEDRYATWDGEIRRLKIAVSHFPPDPAVESVYEEMAEREAHRLKSRQQLPGRSHRAI